MARTRHSPLKNCSLGWNSQLIGQVCSCHYPLGVRYFSPISPLKLAASLFRFSFTSISPPIVQTTLLWISSSEGKTDFTLETVKVVRGTLKCQLQAGTSAASGAPKTSISARSCEEIVMSRSQAAGKKPKSKVSKTYFLMSSSLTAQKQLNPLTFLSSSQTLERNSVEMPTTVRLTPDYTEACSMNCFSPAMLLSPTSVSMITLFSQLVRSCSVTKFTSSCFDSANPLLMVVPPPQVILSRSVQTLGGRSFLQVGGKMVCPWLLKVVRPTESSGLSFEMNILMASTDSFSLDSPRLLWLALTPSPPPMEPEISRQMRALMGISSLSAPSLLLLRKSARQSLILGSNMLLVNWQREYPWCRSTTFSLRCPTSNLISLKMPSQVMWVRSGRLPELTEALNPRVFRAPIMHIMALHPNYKR